MTAFVIMTGGHVTTLLRVLGRLRLLLSGLGASFGRLPGLHRRILLIHNTSPE
jgi:hypothetical protein